MSNKVVFAALGAAGVALVGGIAWLGLRKRSKGKAEVKQTKEAVIAKNTYDNIAAMYKASKMHPWRTHVELNTFFTQVPDQELKGADVLDLACGDGFLTRLLVRKGAAATGVDISSKMIELAEAEEKFNPIGAKYLCKDVSQLDTSRQYTHVFALYLLNYAKTREQLLGFVKVIFAVLKPGGRFVTMNDNVRSAPEAYNSDLYVPYGFTKAMTDPFKRKEGDPITYKMTLPDGATFQFDNYYLSPETYESVFKEVGFVNVKWHNMTVSAEGVEKLGQKYWDNILKINPTLCIEATKPR